MNTHWKNPQRNRPPTNPSRGLLELEFFRHGERTLLGRQFVSYPFHITRPFSLDAGISQLATVYLQSSSGGLYRAEDLSCDLSVRSQAAAHVTTQAATVVHDCHGRPSCQNVRLAVEPGGFLAYTPDPLVLFPGAACHSALEATLSPGSVLLLADAFACHDPQADQRPFDVLQSDVVVRDASGALLMRDSFRVAGADLQRASGPTSGWAVAANFFLLGEPSRLPARDVLAAAGGPHAVLGVTALPGSIGWGVRCLARDAVAARLVAERLFTACVTAVFGAQPSPRRK